MYEKTINEKVYQMSASVSENAKTFLLGMEQDKTEKLSVLQMQGLFKKIEQPIHHIDFDRQNNHPDNLYLCESHEEHKNIHCRLEDIARELCKKGTIKFNNGKYEM